MTDEPLRLTWRNVSTHNLRDFMGYDGERLVARILQEPNGTTTGAGACSPFAQPFLA